MFNVSISDRLKAAVNQLEATGTSLQARATANLNAAGQPVGSGGTGGAAAPGTGQATKAGNGAKSPGGVSSPTLGAQEDGKDGIDRSGKEATGSPASVTSPRLSSSTAVSDPSTSPRATYGASAAHLADSAFSGLTGLRKSFNFRGSQDGARPSAAQLAAAGAGGGGGTGGAKELKDISSSPGTDKANVPTRTASPAGFLAATSFGIGSDPSTAVQTPRQPRSPTPAKGLSRLRSPTRSNIDLPKPDPSDPATYPLPPSPDIGTATLSAPLPQYADPLGASPLVTPSDAAAPPILVTETTGTLDSDSSKGDPYSKPVIGLGLSEAEVEIQAAEATVEAIEHGEPARALEDSAPALSDGQAKLAAINKIIRDLTPLEGGVDDPDAIEGWVRMMKGKVEMTNQELIRLRGQMACTSYSPCSPRCRSTSFADRQCKIPESTSFAIHTA